jgi:YfiH family protein
MNVAHEQSPGLVAYADIAHAFFGREGGLSEGLYASLNVSETTGDDPDLVTDNRRMVAAALGFEAHHLVVLKQVHSAKVVTVTGPLEGMRPEADAMVTTRRGLLLGILTADCTPILLADPEAGVIGAAHAGWRGAVDGIMGNTVEAMVGLGATRERIVAAIGPTISGFNYEVGPQFMADFLDRHPGGEAYFTVPEGGSEHFDLPRFVVDQLHAGTTTGRQIAVIGLT